MRCGCPSIDRKVVNSGKRLRAYVGLDEGEVTTWKYALKISLDALNFYILLITTNFKYSECKLKVLFRIYASTLNYRHKKE